MLLEKKHILIAFIIGTAVIYLTFMVHFLIKDPFLSDELIELTDNSVATFLLSQYVLFIIGTILFILIEGTEVLREKSIFLIIFCIICTPVIPLFILLYIRDKTFN